jgi:hypothetical protein
MKTYISQFEAGRKARNSSSLVFLFINVLLDMETDVLPFEILTCGLIEKMSLSNNLNVCSAFQHAFHLHLSKCTLFF